VCERKRARDGGKGGKTAEREERIVEKETDGMARRQIELLR